MTTGSGTTDWVPRLARSADPRDQAILELATLVSPAPVIESELVRAVRLYVAQRLAVSAEADLWFSPLVKDRSPVGITLRLLNMVPDERDFEVEILDDVERQLSEHMVGILAIVLI